MTFGAESWNFNGKKTRTTINRNGVLISYGCSKQISKQRGKFKFKSIVK